VDDYEAGYTALLRAPAAALPRVRLVVLEPFVLRCGVVTDAWFPEFDRRRAAAARVARGANTTFVGLQALFDRLSSRAPPARWSADGVHPTPAGHRAIADAWREAVRL
jgi:lysophospholipase L1-like esterase